MTHSCWGITALIQKEPQVLEWMRPPWPDPTLPSPHPLIYKAALIRIKNIQIKNSISLKLKVGNKGFPLQSIPTEPCCLGITRAWEYWHPWSASTAQRCHTVLLMSQMWDYHTVKCKSSLEKTGIKGNIHPGRIAYIFKFGLTWSPFTYSMTLDAYHIDSVNTCYD